MSKKGRILVAMSGGIDSSMAALMLHESGYEVIGITMKTWDYSLTRSADKETGCCSLDAMHDARALALRVGFPHYVIDIRDAFKGRVIDYFKEEYLAGRTPNPCVMCNTDIKWRVMSEKALAFDCEKVVTGHYARLRSEGGRYILHFAKDGVKDQTYALWGLRQDVLSRTYFPLGDWYKKDIKQMARDSGFDFLARKSESYEICFIPDNDYRAFLSHITPNLDKRIGKGSFILERTGEEVGQHKGYPFYTIGQRRGLDIALGYPVYVVGIDKARNCVFLGTKEELREKGMLVRGANWIKYGKAPSRIRVSTKIRYNHVGARSVLFCDADRTWILFDEWVEAITPGQAAVFYEDGDVVGGAWIEKRLESVQEDVEGCKQVFL